MRRQPLVLSAGTLGVVAFWLWDLAQGNISALSAALVVLWLVVLRPRLPRWAVWCGLMLCPVIFLPVYAAAQTAFEFAGGTARRSTASYGYPSPSAANLDPVRRVFPRNGGCFPSGMDGVLLATIEREVFDVLFRVYGPMPGAYQGPYPDRDQALDAIQQRGLPVSETDWRRGEFSIGHRRVRLSKQDRSRVSSNSATPLIATLVRDTVLLVAVDLPGFRSVSVFDLERVGWFASYRYTRG